MQWHFSAISANPSRTQRLSYLGTKSLHLATVSGISITATEPHQLWPRPSNPWPRV